MPDPLSDWLAQAIDQLPQMQSTQSSGGYASASVFWCTVVWKAWLRRTSRRASVGQLTSPAVIISAHRLLQLSLSLPFVDQCWATEHSLSLVLECYCQPSLHCHSSFSGKSWRHSSLSSLILLSSLFCLHCVNCLCNIHVTVHYGQFVICSSSSSLVLLFNNIALEQTGQFSVGWHMVWSSCSSIYLHYEKLVFIVCTLRNALIVFVWQKLLDLLIVKIRIDTVSYFL